MSLISRNDGYYDSEGNWIKTKFCFVPCPPDKCTCQTPFIKHIDFNVTISKDNVEFENVPDRKE